MHSNITRAHAAHAARRTPHATGPATHVPMLLSWLVLLAMTGHGGQGLSMVGLKLNTASGWFAAVFVQMTVMVSLC